MQKKQIRKKINENQSILFLFSNNSYKNSVFEVVAQLSRDNSEICYLSLNKFFPMLEEAFINKGIDYSRFVFIDAVSRQFFQEFRKKDVYITKGPHDQVMINTDIAKACVNHDISAVVIDSLPELFLYEDPKKVVSFINFVERKLKSLDIKLLLFCNSDEVDNKKISLVRKNFDVVVKINK